MLERHKLDHEFKEKVIDKLGELYKRFSHQIDEIIEHEYQIFLIKRDLEHVIPPDKSYQVVIFLSDLNQYNFRDYFMGSHMLFEEASEFVFKKLSKDYNKHDFITVVHKLLNDLELVFEFNLEDDSVIRIEPDIDTDTDIDIPDDEPNNELMEDGIDPISFNIDENLENI